MKLIVLGSSSKGNCYLFKGKQETLILECGLPLIEVKKALDFETSSIVGALVSHKHGDHAKYISQFIGFGIDVWASEIYHSVNSRFNLLFENKKTFNIGKFSIMPLKVKHDVECHSFLIHHEECGLVYFVTDTHYIKYNPKNINHLILETNYSQEILDSKSVMPFLRNRIIESHLSLEHALMWYEKIDSSKVESITLTHLSDSNSDEEMFKQKFIEASGKQVHVADSGTSIELSSIQF